jgi:alpha-amylase
VEAIADLVEGQQVPPAATDVIDQIAHEGGGAGGVEGGHRLGFSWDIMAFMSDLRNLRVWNVALVFILASLVTACSHAQNSRLPAGRSASPVLWQLDWQDGAVAYEVFVRSFADSDGDGVGDLQGLISRLDYLNDGDPATTDDLGVTVLWLMPIFESPSYHGYDVIDYERINPDYGTLEDFEDLVAAADARGIRIVLDLVLNHSGTGHPAFQDAVTGAGARYRDWYVWRDTDPGWTQPWGGTWPTWHENAIDGTFYYGVFWGGMPDLNYTNAEVREEAFRLARLWLDRGAGGFRLDAARYLIETGQGQGGQADTPETHEFWRAFARAVREHNPEAMIVAENWSDTDVIATYFGDTSVLPEGDGLPLNFNFPLAGAILTSARIGDPGPVRGVLGDMALHYPEGVRDAPFITNHDQRRVASELDGEDGPLRVAASMLLTLPGVPFLYYGEEVGLENGPSNADEDKRTPMPWNDGPGGGFTDGNPWHPFAPGRDTANVSDQDDDPGSLLNHYRGLIQARVRSEALGGGRFELLDPASGGTASLAWKLETDGETVLVVINLSGGFQTVTGLDVAGRPTEALYEDGAAGNPTGGDGSATVYLQPHGTSIWRFE